MSTMPVDLPPIEMPQVLIYSEACTALRIPASAMNFEGFLAWKESNEFPKQGRISWVNGGLRIDMNAEEFESHSRVKGRIYATLLQHVEKHDLGMIFPDGFSLFNEPTRWQTDPDAMFIAWDTYANKQAEFRVNKKGQRTGVYGSPDWVLEVVSDSSEVADRVELKSIYESIGVREYWVIDGRAEPMSIEIYTLTESGYQAVPVANGQQWQSPVFQCQFQFSRSKGRYGFWDYEFEVK